MKKVMFAMLGIMMLLFGCTISESNLPENGSDILSWVEDKIQELNPPVSPVYINKSKINGGYPSVYLKDYIDIEEKDNVTIVTINSFQENNTLYFPLYFYEEEFVNVNQYQQHFLKLDNGELPALNENEAIWLYPMIKDNKGVLFKAIYTYEFEQCDSETMDIFGETYNVSDFKEGESFFNDDKWKIVFDYDEDCVKRMVVYLDGYFYDLENNEKIDLFFNDERLTIEFEDLENEPKIIIKSKGIGIPEEGTEEEILGEKLKVREYIELDGIKFTVYDIGYDYTGETGKKRAIINITNNGESELVDIYQDMDSTEETAVFYEATNGENYEVKAYMIAPAFTANSSWIDLEITKIEDIESEEKICEDSDGGKNLFEIGILYNGSEEFTDTCSYAGLIEFYCLDNEMKNTLVYCPSGYSCYEGACINSSEVIIESVNEKENFNSCDILHLHEQIKLENNYSLELEQVEGNYPDNNILLKLQIKENDEVIQDNLIIEQSIENKDSSVINKTIDLGDKKVYIANADPSYLFAGKWMEVCIDEKETYFVIYDPEKEYEIKKNNTTLFKKQKNSSLLNFGNELYFKIIYADLYAEYGKNVTIAIIDNEAMEQNPYEYYYDNGYAKENSIKLVYMNENSEINVELPEYGAYNIKLSSAYMKEEIIYFSDLEIKKIN